MTPSEKRIQEFAAMTAKTGEVIAHPDDADELRALLKANDMPIRVVEDARLLRGTYYALDSKNLQGGFAPPGYLEAMGEAFGHRGDD